MNRKPTIILGLLVTLLTALGLGCSPQAKPVPSQVETSAEVWKSMEKQSQGHSPRGQFILASPPVILDTPAPMDAVRRASPSPGQPSLPTTRMSLRMHNADIVAVLQGLSRAAGKSIVMSPGISGTTNLNIVDRPWDEIFIGVLTANKLSYAFDGQTIRVMAAADMQGALDLETIRRKTMVERMAAMQAEPLTTSMAQVRFADAKLLQKTVESTLSKDKDGKPVGNVLVDDLTNSLIILSVEADVAKVTKLLARLDAPRAQIKLKAHIVETTKETARDLGIMWGGTYTGAVSNGNTLTATPSFARTVASGVTTDTYTLGTGMTGTGLGVKLPASSVATNGIGTSLGFIFGKTGGNQLEMQLQALQQDNKLNIISSPSIATMDNQKAYTESGERVPYQSITGTGTNITTSVNFQDAVLRLEITPHIIDDELIRLSVLIQKDEVDTSRTVSGNPYIVKKKTETTLIARNGETVVISGLSKLRNKLSEAGIPGLMDVPGAGWLAKSQSKDDLKDEFMIFITPTVLADWKQGERQKSYEELEQELNAMRKAEADNATAAEAQKNAPKPAAPAEPKKPVVLERSAAPAPAQPIQTAAQASAPAAQQPAQTPAQPSAQAAAPAAADAVDATDETALLKARAAKPGIGGRR